MGFECSMCMETLENPAPDDFVAAPDNAPGSSKRKKTTKKAQVNTPESLARICATACGHMFHRVCINRWFHEKKKKECPSCRKVLTPAKIFNLFPSVSPEDFLYTRVENENAALYTRIAKLESLIASGNPCQNDIPGPSSSKAVKIDNANSLFPTTTARSSSSTSTETAAAPAANNNSQNSSSSLQDSILNPTIALAEAVTCQLSSFPQAQVTKFPLVLPSLDTYSRAQNGSLNLNVPTSLSQQSLSRTGTSANENFAFFNPTVEINRASAIISPPRRSNRFPPPSATVTSATVNEDEENSRIPARRLNNSTSLSPGIPIPDVVARDILSGALIESEELSSLAGRSPRMFNSFLRSLNATGFSPYGNISPFNSPSFAHTKSKSRAAKSKKPASNSEQKTNSTNLNDPGPSTSQPVRKTPAPKKPLAGKSARRTKLKLTARKSTAMGPRYAMEHLNGDASVAFDRLMSRIEPAAINDSSTLPSPRTNVTRGGKRKKKTATNSVRTTPATVSSPPNQNVATRIPVNVRTPIPNNNSNFSSILAMEMSAVGRKTNSRMELRKKPPQQVARKSTARPPPLRSNNMSLRPGLPGGCETPWYSAYDQERIMYNTQGRYDSNIIRINLKKCGPQFPVTTIALSPAFYASPSFNSPIRESTTPIFPGVGYVLGSSGTHYLQDPAPTTVVSSPSSTMTCTTATASTVPTLPARPLRISNVLQSSVANTAAMTSSYSSQFASSFNHRSIVSAFSGLARQNSNLPMTATSPFTQMETAPAAVKSETATAVVNNDIGSSVTGMETVPVIVKSETVTRAVKSDVTTTPDTTTAVFGIKRETTTATSVKSEKADPVAHNKIVTPATGTETDPIIIKCETVARPTKSEVTTPAITTAVFGNKRETTTATSVKSEKTAAPVPHNKIVTPAPGTKTDPTTIKCETVARSTNSEIITPGAATSAGIVKRETAANNKASTLTPKSETTAVVVSKKSKTDSPASSGAGTSSTETVAKRKTTTPVPKKESPRKSIGKHPNVLGYSLQPSEVSHSQPPGGGAASGTPSMSSCQMESSIDARSDQIFSSPSLILNCLPVCFPARENVNTTPVSINRGATVRIKETARKSTSRPPNYFGSSFQNREVSSESERAAAPVERTAATALKRKADAAVKETARKSTARPPNYLASSLLQTVSHGSAAPEATRATSRKSTARPPGSRMSPMTRMAWQINSPPESDNDSDSESSSSDDWLSTKTRKKQKRTILVSSSQNRTKVRCATFARR